MSAKANIVFRGLILGFILNMSFAGYGAEPPRYTFKEGNNELVWYAKGSSPIQASRLDITGRGGFVKGEVVLDKGEYKGTLKVDVRGFKTDAEKRDEHLQGYLESNIYPVAILSIKKAPLGGNAFEGDLTVKGVTKPVKGSFKLEAGKLDASFALKLSDYPIGTVKYLGVGIEDEVKVEVNAKFPF